MSAWDKIHRRIKGFFFRNLPGMTTCRELEDFIADYEDGALPRSKRFVFELHLATCSDCRRYHGAYRGSIALSKAVFQKSDETMSAEVPEDLVNAILYARGQKP